MSNKHGWTWWVLRFTHRGFLPGMNLIPFSSDFAVLPSLLDIKNLLLHSHCCFALFTDSGNTSASLFCKWQYLVLFYDSPKGKFWPTSSRRHSWWKTQMMLLSSALRSVPKFMKRIKVPDYKEKSVFGVPLIVHVQRCGFPLPLCLQQALSHLRAHCLDQVREAVLLDCSRSCLFHLNSSSLYWLSRCPIAGWIVPEIWRQVPYPGLETAVWAVPWLRKLWGPVCLRRGRHGQTVLQRLAWAAAHEQAGGNVPAHLPM